MDHHCLGRAAIRVKMNILHAQTRACTRTLKMNFFLDAVHQQGTPRAGHLGSVCSHHRRFRGQSEIQDEAESKEAAPNRFRVSLEIRGDASQSMPTQPQREGGAARKPKPVGAPRKAKRAHFRHTKNRSWAIRSALIAVAAAAVATSTPASVVTYNELNASTSTDAPALSPPSPVTPPAQPPKKARLSTPGDRDADPPPAQPPKKARLSFPGDRDADPGICRGCPGAPKSRHAQGWPPRQPRRKYRILDLGCGTKSVLKALHTLLDPDGKRNPKKRKHVFTYVSFDKERRFDPTIVGDVAHWYKLLAAKNKNYVKPGWWDVVWASPSCGKFSPGKRPAATEEELKAALKEVSAVLLAIKKLAPKTYFVENSKNVLRNHTMMSKLPAPYEFSYCMYGSACKKDGRVWSNVRGVETMKCCAATKCSWLRQGNKKHARKAQFSYSLTKTGQRRYDGTPKEALYVVPESLMRDFMGEALKIVSQDYWSKETSDAENR